ncbi:metal-dependent hydrolase [Pseudomonas sp. MAP12]|uniref:Metal-dependent hydrolase n=1 Tax=Geopseudomonas aromaticivorans TaxID=2849492 RepID=A0ABS6MTI3_9GAMM|nr:metal-dependent hydrolase [Pseudomonas aromaticivorans]MBV2132117.1 metal-dependent hydrolase [Pseudomonas aromaticivorans]
MDALAHALLGATLAQAAPARCTGLQPRQRLAFCSIAAIFPDIDFIGFLVDPLRFLADWHQGPTHSLILLPLWAALIGGAFALAGKRQAAFLPACAFAAVGLASHISLDLMTAYGTALFHPISKERFWIGSLFLVDPLFLLIALGALVASLRLRKRWPAVAGIALLALYAGEQTLQQQRANEIARQWAQANGIAPARVVALAQPLSPFNWKLLVVDGDRYHQAHLKLDAGGGALPIPGPLGELAWAYRPSERLAWQLRHRYGADAALQEQMQARWHDPRFASYRRFAIFPALSRIDRGDETCIWFTDLRYDLPALPDTFRYGFCRGGDTLSWRLYRLRYFSADSRQGLESED